MGQADIENLCERLRGGVTTLRLTCEAFEVATDPGEQVVYLDDLREACDGMIDDLDDLFCDDPLVPPPIRTVQFQWMMEEVPLPQAGYP
ncbi:MAG TPA: hypothetical protein VGI81_13335 [Tepidisphaeraceae bacterium]|jgi:hypothetical protein